MLDLFSEIVGQIGNQLAEMFFVRLVIWDQGWVRKKNVRYQLVLTFPAWNVFPGHVRSSPKK